MQDANRRWPAGWSSVGAAWWPWLFVLALGLWLVWPLWSAQRVFAGKLATDNVVTPWFFDYVARALRGDVPLDRLADFNWPRPIARADEFPSLADAALATPLVWLFGWPRDWGVIQGVAVLVNGLGAAALARALGARGLGVAFAGALGLLARLVWKDLAMGRMNATWPGLALLALAAWLAVLVVDVGPWRRLGLAALAAVAGAVAALVYPPFVAMMVPVGAVLALWPLRRARPLAWLMAALAVAGGLALAWPELARILAGQVGGGLCRGRPCPDTYWAIRGEHLWLWKRAGRAGLSIPGVAGATWIALPLALLHRRRLALIGVALVGAWYVLISLGPCPEWPTGHRLALSALPALGGAWTRSLCLVESVHDYARFASLAALLAGVLGGLGLEALGRRRWWGRGLAWAVALGVLASSLQLWRSEVLDPEKWQRVPQPVTATFLAANPGPAAELPFDRAGQFLSVLATPGPRLNPLRPGDHAPSADPFIAWLWRAGNGELTRPLPTAEQAAASGLRWVLYDPERCASTPGGRGCDADFPWVMRQILGSPRELGDGVVVWDAGG